MNSIAAIRMQPTTATRFPVFLKADKEWEIFFIYE